MRSDGLWHRHQLPEFLYMKGAGSSEMSVSYHNSTGCHDPKDHKLKELEF